MSFIVPTEKFCQCRDIREGAIFRGDILGNWWLECPRCHKQQKDFSALKEKAND